MRGERDLELEKALSRMTAAFEGDAELREELKAELRHHVEDSRGDGGEDRAEEALARLGTVEALAAELEQANRGRLKGRAVASLVLRRLLLPGSVALALAIGWTEGRRVLGFQAPSKLKKWIEKAEDGSLWAYLVLWSGWSRIGNDTSRRAGEWALARSFLYEPATASEGKGRGEEAAQRRRLMDLTGYLSAKRSDLAKSAHPAQDWFETFNGVYDLMMRTVPGEEAVEELVAFCEEIDPGNGYYALVLAGWQHTRLAIAEQRGRAVERDGWSPEPWMRSEVANRLLDEAFRAERLEYYRSKAPDGAAIPRATRFEERVAQIGDAITDRGPWPHHLLGLIELVEERVESAQSAGDTESVRRTTRRYVEFLHHMAGRVSDPYGIRVIVVMARQAQELDPAVLHTLDGRDSAQLSRITRVAPESFPDPTTLIGTHRYTESGVLGAWHGVLGTRPSREEAEILRRIDYVLIERLVVAMHGLVFGVGLLALLVLQFLGPRPKEGLPLRLLLRCRDYLWLVLAGTGVPLLLYLFVTQWTPLGGRELDAAQTLFSWMIQAASLAALIVGLNWTLAHVLVRRRFVQLGMGKLARRVSRGGLAVVLAALVVFLLAPLAGSGEPGERWWAGGLGLALAGVVLGIVFRWVLGIMRCKSDPKARVPAQTAVAGVTAVALALAGVLLGTVIAPLLRGEEARLLAREASLRVDPESGLIEGERRQVEEFRALALGSDSR